MEKRISQAKDTTHTQLNLYSEDERENTLGRGVFPLFSPNKIRAHHAAGETRDRKPGHTAHTHKEASLRRFPPVIQPTRRLSVAYAAA